MVLPVMQLQHGLLSVKYMYMVCYCALYSMSLQTAKRRQTQRVLLGQIICS
jgi:hypothetical protein